MPSLVFTTTNAKGSQRVKLFKKITTLGQEPTNDVVFDDPSVQSNHAVIHFDGKHYNISQVSKKCVVFVNGKKEKAARLVHHDKVTLGEVELLFDLYDELAMSPDDSVNQEIASYRKLYEFTSMMMSRHTVEEILDHLMDTVIEVTGASNGFLILRDETDRFHITAARNVQRETIQHGTDYVSDTIIQQVIEERRALIVSDAMNEDAYKNAASVLDLKLSSVMCAPLIVRENLFGILYVGNNDIINLFTPHKLELLEIFASQAALVIQNALAIDELKLDQQQLKDQIDQMRQGAIIGSSEVMQDVFRKISKVAQADIPVLIRGETGTGKELVAHEIHNQSHRAKGPFVAINCGAIPQDLLESELFGHKRGAFTGAVSDKSGKFKAAHQGTLFLDEIGDMPMALQVKILRALEEHTILPVGSTKPEKVDIRVIAATNRPLEKMVETQEFREDLYYRLNVVGLELPSLKDRDDDTLLIAKYFLKRYAEEYKAKITGFSPKASEAIRLHSWPGNVRELENRVKKAIVMAEKSIIEAEDLDLENPQPPVLKTLAEAREEFQQKYILEALRYNANNRTKTAKMLDVDPRTIFRYLEKMEQ